MMKFIIHALVMPILLIKISYQNLKSDLDALEDATEIHSASITKIRKSQNYKYGGEMDVKRMGSK